MPGVLGLAGAAGAGLAIVPVLQVLTWPLAAIGAAFLARGWWLQVRHGIAGAWSRRSLVVLSLSTALVAVLWTARLLGLLTPS